tara:strand:- start:279 stop:1871 length:1593 start_codon:yes stop_codon:yes gene_type:complete
MNNILLLFIGNLNNFFLEFLKDTIGYNIINVLRSVYKIDILIISNLEEEYNATMFNKTHDITKIKDYMNLYDIDYKIIYDGLSNISYNGDEYELTDMSDNIIRILQYFINKVTYSHIINIPYNCFFTNKFNKYYLNDNAIICNYYSTFDLLKHHNTRQYNLILPSQYFNHIEPFIHNNIDFIKNNTEHIDISEPLLFKYQLKLGNNPIYNEHIDTIKGLVSYVNASIHYTDKIQHIHNYYKELRPRMLRVQNITEDDYNKLSFVDFPDNVKELYYKHQNDKPNICIFVQGQVRTFIYKEVYESWIEHLIKPLHKTGYNYHFIFMFDIINEYSWQDINKDKMKLGDEEGQIDKKLVECIIINKLKVRNFNILYHRNNDVTEQLENMNIIYEWGHNSQMYKTYKLYKFMKHIETKKKTQFNYIIKLRPDLKLNDSIIINSITPQLNKYMHYRSDLIYIIPIHLYNIIFDTRYVISIPRINDFIKSIQNKFFILKKDNHNLCTIEYHYIYLYHLWLYNIKSIESETYIYLVRP